MQLALAHHEPRPANPIVSVARDLAALLRTGKAIDARLLNELFAAATGRSATDAAWSTRDAYDALELAQVLLLSDPAFALDDPNPQSTLARLVAITATLPTQSVRSEDQVALQQFSTPAPIAWIAGQAASVVHDDTVLEPSAGTGLLAFTAARAGAHLLLNEIDDCRRALLAKAFPLATVTGYDGELIDDLLDPALTADIVLINPPFARSLGRERDRNAAERHLAAACRRLNPGGRLVAIMPRAFEAPAFAARTGMSLRLAALLAPGLYEKHGTSVAVRFCVFDRCADARPPVALETDDLHALLLAVLALPPRRTSTPAPSRPSTLSLFRRAKTAPPRPMAMPRSQGSPSEPRPIAVEPLDNPASAGSQVGIYLPWRPSRMRLARAADHPTPLVESIAMGSIAAPKPVYAPLLPSRLVTDGILSAAQLETLVYAGGAFERDLPGTFLPVHEGVGIEPAAAGHSYRQGYFLGDGTGAGKGRQVAGIILDQWLRGRRRHIWLSKNESLIEDARRDWTALGGLALDIQSLSQWKLGAPLELDAGILFVTYPTLRSGREDATRLQQILGWAGRDFDGAIAFDEAHALANAAGGEGSRGKIKGSEQGVAGLRPQNLLPRARVLYASATGASDVANLSYATRLGLWGPGTAFADRDAFVTEIRQGGIAAMELVARDLKALGLYTARVLSFAGVEYELLEHALTPAQTEIYDAYAEAWAIIHGNLEAALETTRVVDSASGQTLNANAKSAAISRFEGVKQRFFGQLLLSAKLPSLLPAIESDLGDGHAVVIQLVSTAEAMLGRRLAELDPSEREALELDLSPREYVIDYLVNAFPTRQMKLFTDKNGDVRSEPMSDKEGRPVHCREAIAARDALVEQLCALPPIGAALDGIIERFGKDNIAEVTGRTRRLVIGKDGRQRLERRGSRSNLVETAAFMDGSKRLLVFSDAGGTGRSYHACLNARNQARRIHYLLEPGWRADAAIQGLGRTHRSAQASAPLFRPVTTDARGERRFISTIARRLDSLGALTRGQRQTGGQNLFDPADNLESGYAKDALLAWYRMLYAGKLQAISFDDFQDRSGLKLESPEGGLRDDLPPIQRWLNRLLAFPIALQNAIFDEYLALVEARVDAARQAGTLDLGVETLPVDRFTIAADKLIRTDSWTGATSHLLTVEIERRARPMMLEAVRKVAATRRNAMLLVNRRSGRAAMRVDGRSLMAEDGLPVRRYELIRPLKREHVACDGFEETSWEAASDDAFISAWQAECDEATNTVRRETLHLATGLLLPIWDKLPDDHVRVTRIVDSDGQSLLGREVPALALAELGQCLGLELKTAMPPAEIAAAVMQASRPLPISPGSRILLKRSLVGGAQRLEFAGFEAARLPEYKALGCFTEIIRYQTRLFVPVDRAAEIIDRLPD